MTELDDLRLAHRRGRSNARWYGRRWVHVTRDEAVRSQYDPPEVAAGYADSYAGTGTGARYFHSRLHLIREALDSCKGGDLLDAGCGPGMMVTDLLDTRPGDFRITAVDRSASMVAATTARCPEQIRTGEVTALQGRVEALPFPDDSFDVVLAMGVLEYADAPLALREMSRVTRPGGLVLATMLNPTSPYRLTEWFLYWPFLRGLGLLERTFGVPEGRRHGVARTGIWAYTPHQLVELMAAAGLGAERVTYYDLTPLVPPFDRWWHGWVDRPARTVTHGPRKWTGTAYLVTARQGLDVPESDRTPVWRPERQEP